jgi:hypothetical protein
MKKELQKLDNHCRSTATAIANTCCTALAAILFEDIQERYNYTRTGVTKRMP